MFARNRLATRAKLIEVFSHSPLLIEGMRFSPKEFYKKVEFALALRAIPDLKVIRIDWKEGGPLSARREYLRISRERLIFDVCAAPFGTGFFVSLWFGQKPLRIGLVILILVVLGFIATFNGLTRSYFYAVVGHSLGIEQGTINTCVLWTFAIGLLYLLIRIGPNLDQFLISTPVLGFLYERYFRRITYFRVDQTCMYRAAVEAAVREVINEITKANGIQPMSELSERPIFRSLVGRSNTLASR